MRTAWNVALKDLRLLARDPVALFWVLAFPLLFALFFGTVMKSGLEDELQPLSVVVVNDAGSAESRRLVALLEASPALRARGSSVSEAERAVRRAEASAFVRIPAAFSSGSPHVQLGLDPSRAAEGAVLEATITDLVARALAPSTQARPSPIAKTAVLPAGRSTNGYGIVFPAAVLWGLMGCAAAFAIGMVTERTSGTLLRLRTSPVSLAGILSGKALACFLACAVDAALLVGVGHWLFGVTVGSTALTALAIVCASACFAGITMALSVLGKTEQAVAGAGWSTLIVMAMLGGGMVPLSVMPDWLAAASDVSPVKWGILALEGAVWRGFDAVEMLLPCAVLGGVGAVGFATGLGLMARQEAS